MQHFAVCSNPECDYSTSFSGSAALQFILEHPKDSSGGLTSIESVLPKDRYCEVCGAALLFFCLHCKKGLFTDPNAKYCRHCGKEIKKDNWANGDRRKLNKLKGPERRSGLDRRFGGRPKNPE